MICPGCARDNASVRRYCGGCGCNFDPACAACGFANEPRDRYCGGCGAGLRASGAGVPASGAGVHASRASLHAATASAVARPASTPAGAASPWAAAELAELFAPAPVVEEQPMLPEAGIRQSDIDRLFGSTR